MTRPRSDQSRSKPVSARKSGRVIGNAHQLDQSNTLSDEVLPAEVDQDVVARDNEAERPKADSVTDALIQENHRLSTDLEAARNALARASQQNLHARQALNALFRKFPSWLWWVWPFRSMPLASQRNAIRRSRLFDAEYYCDQNEDVRAAGVDPLLHYLLFGGFEGRMPNPYFNSAWYLDAYKDLPQSGVNPLAHYVMWGAKEKRAAGPLFDTRFYLETNADVAKSKINPLLHYLRHGRAEGRIAFRTQPLTPRPMAPSDSVWKNLAAARRNQRRSPLVDIVVPVFRGYNDTLACIHSVLEARQDTPYELIVVDDCSPEKDLSRKLGQLSRLGLFTLLTNRTNSGFIASVNRGMALHKDRDILLLNSDTVVYNNWLDRIVVHAQAARTATVTPLSTNATICSYPTGNRDNPELLELEYAELDRLCAEANRGTSIELPTAVGFCMFIRRACLDEIGLFDEIFGKGYGEENDFCRRAAEKGWANVLAADVFVRHTGEISFATSSSSSQRRATKILEEKHPDYPQKIREFIQANPVAPIRRRLDAARIGRATAGQAILHISHTWGGGVERHVADLAAMWADQGVATVHMTAPVRGKSLVKIDMFPSLNLPNLSGIDLAEDLVEIAELLKLAGITQIHIHSLAGWPIEATQLIRKLASLMRVPYHFTFHDYLAFCPRINMIDHTDRYCGEKGVETCKSCLKANGSPFGKADIVEWCTNYQTLLEGADTLIAPSDDTARRVKAYLNGTAKILVRPHPERIVHDEAIAVRWKSGARLRIVVIGAIGPHKGSKVLLAMAQDAEKRSLPLDFTIIGYTDRDASFAKLANVKMTGRYHDPEIFDLLRQHAGHVAFIPSVCPETYCYALSTLLSARYPIIAFDLGAPADRLRNRKNEALLLPIALAAQASEINNRILANASKGLQPSKKLGPPLLTYSLQSYYQEAPSD